MPPEYRSWDTVVVVSDDGGDEAVERDAEHDAQDDSGEVLLATGAAIWVTNVIAFSLWYWLLDRGGPAARAAGVGSRPSFVFSEMQSADVVAPAGSRSMATTSTSPSPTPLPSAPPTACP